MPGINKELPTLPEPRSRLKYPQPMEHVDINNRNERRSGTGFSRWETDAPGTPPMTE